VTDQEIAEKKKFGSGLIETQTLVVSPISDYNNSGSWGIRVSDRVEVCVEISHSASVRRNNASITGKKT
jgi:hypothetical protein